MHDLLVFIFRVITDLWKNFQNHVIICLSLQDIRNMNFSLLIITKFNLWWLSQHSISREFMRFGGKTSYRLLNRGAALFQVKARRRPRVKPLPDSKVHGSSMGPIWGRKNPGGPHVGPMNFAIWDYVNQCWVYSMTPYGVTRPQQVIVYGIHTLHLRCTIS